MDQPSALSEAGGLLGFFGIVGLFALCGHGIRTWAKRLQRPRYILEVADTDDGDSWFQPDSSRPTRDLAHVRWAARQWRDSGYDVRIINLNDLGQEG